MKDIQDNPTLPWNWNYVSANPNITLKDIQDNPILQIAKLIIFPRIKNLSIERPAKFGGNISFSDYETLENAYKEDKLHPTDLKSSLIEELKNEGDIITLYKVIYKVNGDTEQVPTKSIVNPKWKLYFSLVETNNKISGDYGFSPVSRMKFSLPKQDEPADPFAAVKFAFPSNTSCHFFNQGILMTSG